VGKDEVNWFVLLRASEWRYPAPLCAVVILIYIFHWSFLQLPMILMVCILDWITVCIVDVCVNY